MSILLDALRKSEEQRRLGKVPDIHSPAASEQAGSGPWRRWAVRGAAVAIAVAVVWIGWRQFGTSETAPDATAEAAEAISVGADGAEGAEQPAQAPPRDRSDAAAKTAQRAPEQSPSRHEVSEVPVAAQENKVAPRKARVNQSFTEFEASRQAVAEQAPVEPPQEIQPAPRAAEASVAPTRDQPSASPAPRSAEPRATEPISFWELPQKVRDSLPDLRITVLVYAERPEDRFVLLAGNRMVEKDALPDGVVLDEIRRDGAVFTYRNYRFLVKG
jgi:general secretion pathway protein B